MKIYFNSGFTIMEEKEPKCLWIIREREANENITNICARIKIKEMSTKINRLLNAPGRRPVFVKPQKSSFQPLPGDLKLKKIKK